MKAQDTPAAVVATTGNVIRGVFKSTPNNVPGPRYEGIGWVDLNQNFWLFTGYYSPIYSSTFYYNDVWRLLP